VQNWSQGDCCDILNLRKPQTCFGERVFSGTTSEVLFWWSRGVEAIVQGTPFNIFALQLHAQPSAHTVLLLLGFDIVKVGIEGSDAETHPTFPISTSWALEPRQYVPNDHPEETVARPTRCGQKHSVISPAVQRV
jgi:hypothetical protein